MLRRDLTLPLTLVRELWYRTKAQANERRHALVGPLHLWKEKRRFQYDFLLQSGLQRRHRLVDIGCGTLRGGIPLLDYLEPGHYWGLEARAEVLDAARVELKEARLEDKNPQLIVSDKLGQLQLDVQFDFAWAFSVLIHMPNKVLDECLAFVGRHLRSKGIFFANVQLGHSEESRWKWQGFPIVWRPLDFYVERSRRYGLAVEDLGTLGAMQHCSGLKTIDNQHMLRFTQSA